MIFYLAQHRFLRPKESPHKYYGEYELYASKKKYAAILFDSNFCFSLNFANCEKHF